MFLKVAADIRHRQALVLLRHGADATLRDALGRSAEDWAGPQLWASLLRQAALAPDSIDDKDDNDDQWDSSVEGVDQHRATGLLSSAPRPRPGAISLVARYSPTTTFFPPFSLFDHCARVVRVCVSRGALRCLALW